MMNYLLKNREWLNEDKNLVMGFLIKQLISFDKLLEIYMSMFAIHILISSVINSLYVRTLFLLKSEHQNSVKINIRIQTLRSWIKYLAPFEPDLSFSNLCSSFCISMYTCTIIYLRNVHYLRPELSSENFSCIQFIGDTEGENGRIRARLINYINDLKMSNRIYVNKTLNQEPKFGKQLQLLHDELQFLKNLRYNISSIWPTNRSDKWKKQARNIATKIALASYFGIYLSLLVWNSYFLNSSRRYRMSRSLNYESSFLSTKLFLDLFIGIFVGADMFSREAALTIVSIADHIKLVSETRESIRNFMLKCAALREMDHHRYLKHRDKLAHWTNKRFSIRMECNKLALEAYIKFRYQIDMMTDMNKILGNIFTAAICFLSSFAVLVLLMMSLIDIKNEEIAIQFILTVNLYGILNLVLILFAFIYTHSYKMFIRSHSICAISLIDHQEDPHQSVGDPRVSLYDRLIISSHTHFLWQKITKDSTGISKKLAILLPGGYQLHYESLIKFNLTSLYIMMFYNSHLK